MGNSYQSEFLIVVLVTFTYLSPPLFLLRYCKVNLGDISAVELWHLFSSTIEGLFDNDTNLEVFSPNEYLTLLFTVSVFSSLAVCALKNCTYSDQVFL